MGVQIRQPETLSTAPNLSSVETVSGHKIEKIDEGALLKLKEKAYAYRAAKEFNDYTDEHKEKRLGQISAMREFLAELQKHMILLERKGSRFVIQSSSLTPDILPEHLKKNLESTIGILYENSTPVSEAMSEVDISERRDISSAYNATDEIVNMHLAKASAELCLFLDPSKAMLSDSITLLNLPSTIRSGQKPLSTLELADAINKKSNRSVQEEQFLLAEKSRIEHANLKVNDADKEKHKKNKEEFEKILTHTLTKAGAQLSVVQGSNTDLGKLGNAIAKSVNFDTTKFTPMKDWTDVNAIVSNTGEALKQGGVNLGYNMFNHTSLAIDTPYKFFSVVLGVLAWVFPSIGDTKIGKLLKLNGMGVAFTSWLTGGKTPWEVLKSAGGQATEQLKEDPNAPLTEDEKKRLTAAQVSEENWLKPLGMSQAEAQVMAAITEIPVGGMFDYIQFNEQKKDIVYNPNMFTEGEKAILKKLPNYNPELGFRKMLQSIYNKNVLDIQAMLQLPVGNGPGSCTKEYAALKYLEKRYNYTLRTDSTTPPHEGYYVHDRGATLYRIYEFEMTDSTNTTKKNIEAWYKSNQAMLETKRPKPLTA